MRQAFAGMMWSKQFYHYVVGEWLEGDPAPPPPPTNASGPQPRMDASLQRRRHLDARQMGIPVVRGMGPRVPLRAARACRFEFAKEQLCCMLREWYMHPNGQLPAYEWAFGDVNPPVHAWAAWRVYKIDKKRRGVGDRAFLERVFHKLLLNFTWWVNRKDAEGHNIFRAASSASTTSASSTAARRCPPAATSSRPTAPAGWRCTA